MSWACVFASGFICASVSCILIRKAPEMKRSISFLSVANLRTFTDGHFLNDSVINKIIKYARLVIFSYSETNFVSLTGKLRPFRIHRRDVFYIEILVIDIKHQLDGNIFICIHERFSAPFIGWHNFDIS